MKISGESGADLSRISISIDYLDNENTFVQSDLCIAILFNKLWNSSGEKLFAGEY